MDDLFKPLAETIIHGSKIVVVNISAPNDASQHVFLEDRSIEFTIPYTNDNLALGGHFNCTITTLDQKGGTDLIPGVSVESRSTWLYMGKHVNENYFFILKQLKDRVMECKILPTIYHSDSSDVALFVSDKKVSSLGDLGPGRLLNSLLSDTNYVIILT